jgi:hypothetical protein
MRKIFFTLIITILTIQTYTQSPFEKKGMWGISFGTNLFFPESMNAVSVDFCPSVDHSGKYSWNVFEQDVHFKPYLKSFMLALTDLTFKVDFLFHL